MIISVPVSSSPPAALHPQIFYRYLPAPSAAHAFLSGRSDLYRRLRSDLHLATGFRFLLLRDKSCIFSLINMIFFSNNNVGCNQG